MHKSIRRERCCLCLSWVEKPSRLAPLCTICKKIHTIDRELGAGWVRRKQRRGKTWKAQHSIFLMVKAWYSDSKEDVFPSWSEGSRGARLQYDIVIPSLKLCIEVQGRQHDGFIKYFHKTPREAKRQQERDKEKIDLAHIEGYKILLLYLPINWTAKELYNWCNSNKDLQSSRELIKKNKKKTRNARRKKNAKTMVRRGTTS